MKFPRVRFTIQRMMVVVAVVALTLGGIAWVVRMKRLSSEYERRAQKHVFEIQSLFNAAFASEHDYWSMEMIGKYRNASKRPWIPVEPDPPEPPVTK